MITLNNLTDEISSIIEEYSKEVMTEIESKLDETADLIIESIKKTAPRSGKKGAIADDFIKKDIGKGHLKTIVIYAENKGSITHLLEFGYMHKNGTYIGPRPFIRPSYDNLTPKMLDEIRGIINGRSW